MVIKLSTLTDISLALDQQGVKHIASIGHMLRVLRLQLEPAGVAESCTKGHCVRHMREAGKVSGLFQPTPDKKPVVTCQS